jgi:hypothetical protein
MGMPFGLAIAPASFQSLMNHVFVDHLRNCVLVFVVNILFYSATLVEHVRHLRSAFTLLQQHNLLVKYIICLFA